MKKNNIIKGVVALGVLALIGGGVLVANAAANGSANPMHLFGSKSKIARQAGRPAGKKLQTPLTDAQKATMQTEQAAVKTALDNSDYNAWVTAVTAMSPNSPLLKQVTASNFSAYVANYKKKETAATDMKAKTAAVKTALDNGDYNAWVTAVTAVNAKSPILQKITSANFSTYVSAVKLEEQAASIMTSLGISGPGMGNQGMGGFGGGYGGFGFGGPGGLSN